MVGLKEKIVDFFFCTEKMNLEKAEGEFVRSCKKMGITYWGEGVMKENSPYYVGLTLDWPNKEGEELQAEVDSIYDTASRVAEKYNFSPIFDGPSLMAGGAIGMYVGFGEKSESGGRPSALPQVRMYVVDGDGSTGLIA